MEIQAAVAKIGKYASSESGDTVEMIERPHGGLSLVMADGQRSGRSAKAISNVVARKAISLLAEGVRDGAAARATHDYLYTYRGGKVQATLNIVSVDLVTHTLVISRNTHCPVIVATPQGLRVLDEPSQPIGIYKGTKPVITELSIEPGTYVVAFTDGVLHAGEHTKRGPLDVIAFVDGWLAHAPEAETLADALLSEAMARDEGRPRDDMTVLVVAVLPRAAQDDVRRLVVRIPL